MPALLPLAVTADGEDVERHFDTDDHHCVGRNNDLRLTLYRVPKEVATDNHVGTPREEALEAVHERADHNALQEVLRHGFAVAIWVDDVVECRWFDRGHAHHATPFES